MSLFLHQIWRNVAFCITCSAMDALQWMGAVRMRVQTADKNITIIHKVIHTSPVHQLISWEAKWNKSIIKTSICCFCPKYESIIHNNASSNEKVHLLLSLTSKSSHILFRTVLTCKQCLICADFSPDSDQTTFSLEEALLWIMELYFSYKHLNDGFVSAFVFSRC